MLVAITVALFTQSVLALLPGAMVAFLIMLVFRRNEIYSGRGLTTIANWVTILRLLVVFVGVANYDALGSLAFAGIMLGAVLLDGVDGYLAKRLGQMTEVGADLDMETDAFYVACTSIIAFQDFEAGYIVLSAGMLRYVFVWLLRVLNLNTVTSPKVPGARQIAAIYFVVLILPHMQIRLSPIPV